VGKKYPRAQAIANAGAFRFGELITSMFGWPVRFLSESTDRGVEAEIEVRDEDNNASGRPIRAHIVTTNYSPCSGAIMCILFVEDLECLCELTIPVVVVYVDMSAHPGVYWRPLDRGQLASEAPMIFTFGQDDLMIASAKSKLAALRPLRKRYRK
jgi:hypothetical protein